MPDDCDLATGASIDCDLNAVPDECEPDCNRNGVADACDLAGEKSADCNRNDVPDECDTQAGVSFAPPVDLAVEAAGVMAGDLDRDGDQDLVLTLSSAGAAVRLNRGDGALAAAETVGSGRAHVLGDLNGDGAPDLGDVDGADGKVRVHLNRGDATFAEAGALAAARRLTRLRTGDLDGDGDLDLAADDVDGGISILLNRGTAEFDAPIAAAVLSRAPRDLLVGDLDGDGRADLVTWMPLTFLRSRGAEGFAPIALETLGGLQEVAAADLDRDGDLDLAASDGDDTALLLNSGQGAFAAAVRLGCCGFAGPVLASDLDLDGDLDLVLKGFVDRDLALLTLLQGHQGDFRAGPLPVARQPADKLLAADLSGDAYPDLITLAFFDVECPVCPSIITSFLLNRTTPPAHPDDDHNGVPDDCEASLFHRGDPNADGGVDLSDAVSILKYLFLGAAPASCAEAADTDNNGVIDMTDAIALLQYLFGGGPPPAAPGPTSEPCGPDADPPGSPRDLGCEAYGHCG